MPNPSFAYILLLLGIQRWALRYKATVVRCMTNLMLTMMMFKSVANAVVNLIKHFMIVIYASRVVLTRKLRILRL